MKFQGGNWRIGRYPLKILRIICFKFAFPECENDVLAVSGRVIKDIFENITNITEITHNCILKYTKMSHLPSKQQKVWESICPVKQVHVGSIHINFMNFD